LSVIATGNISEDCRLDSTVTHLYTYEMCFNITVQIRL